jgi:asparagine synthase (glutamine-hydrolysing)
MCGIVIVIGKDSEQKAKASLDKLKHRGSDAYNIQTIDNISMGFTRLAINDKSSKGEQPFNFSNHIGLFNAEIYNHKELSQKYELKLNSKSDSEVILPLYEKFKEESIFLLDGFFSGVIYNKNKKKLYLLRDYIGKKPLFFAYDDERIYIVSELKVLPKIKYFETVPKGISELKDRKIHLIKGYETTTLSKSKKLLKESIYNAVKKRVIGIENMKVGVFLSGGLDSAIVATLISKLVSSDKVHYYCMADSNYEDLKYIKIMKKFLHINEDDISYIPLPDKNLLPSVLEQVVYATESINPSIISNGMGAYLLSKKVHEDGLKVVITGDGADELFLGYQDRNIIKKTDNWKKLQQDFIDELHLTELRRIDLACMANSVEVRCPYLDKQVYDIVVNLEYSDFFGVEFDSLNKNILRKIFRNELPKEIINRKKVSFDVGSGLQKMLIELCTKDGLSESDYLKKIWNKLFMQNLSEVSTEPYFWSYPQFDKVISKRGKKYDKQ